MIQLRPGLVISGKYELLAPAGEGGMASVWHASARGAAGFSRAVAMKMIKQEFEADDGYVQMFVEEARVGSELQHANIVQVHDFGIDGKTHYLVMEWIDGMSLSSWVWAHSSAGLRTPWTLVTAIGIEALRGLGAAHARHKGGQPAPVIHRDVSPENILLGANGIVKITDFGLARAKDRAARMTRPGTVKGKVSYLSPERTIGKEASPQSDLFAMGIVLWECLAARKLFEGQPVEVIRKIMHGEILPLGPLRPDLPPELIRVIHTALEPRLDLRYPSAREMAQALADVLRSVPRISDSFLGGSVLEARARLSELEGSFKSRPATSLKIEIEVQDPVTVIEPGSRRVKPPGAA